MTDKEATTFKLKYDTTHAKKTHQQPLTEKAIRFSFISATRFNNLDTQSMIDAMLTP